MQEIIQIFVGGYDNFVYLIADRDSQQCMLVDPAWQSDLIKEIIAKNNLSLSGILLTHSHFDHVNALEDFYRDDLPLYIGAAEVPFFPECPPKAILLQDGDAINFANTSIKAIATPGHTKGSFCYQIGNNLLTGDTLFINGCGRTDLPGGDAQELYFSLQKIKQLSPELMLWTGHNYGDTNAETLGEQIKRNPYLRLSKEDAFVQFRIS